MKPRKTTMIKRRSKNATRSSATVAAVGDSSAELASGSGNTLHELIAVEAYFCAERRGFAPASELDDWLEAEARVNARLAPDSGQRYP